LGLKIATRFLMRLSAQQARAIVATMLGNAVMIVALRAH
jgi:hypothetical protein